MIGKNFLFQHTSAWVPVAMSIAALLVLIAHLLVFGIRQPQADEGAAARIFQLLIVLQAPIILFFAFSNLAKKPKQALMVLALQISAIIVALMPVYLLEL